ncbi:hypothetical protein [Fodinicola acaciae]|uniref:hypothetical protein n=1 Tax=Fodinicola acaciae TaxID=2681555 RepID=UPI0013D4D5CC|nr:hypothetical protein [Fodinicola acaciae]
MAGLVAATALAVGPASPAAADPGFCGVRAGGPTQVGGSMSIAYQVRNRCGYGMNMRIRTPSDGFESSCAWIPAYGDDTFYMRIPDPNWLIIIC